MKPVEELVQYNPENSFLAFQYSLARFDAPWHFHKEHEILYIKEGTGTFYVGDMAGRYGQGDIFFTGYNLPHVWISDPGDVEAGRPSAAIVIQLPVRFHERDFLSLPELSLANGLFSMAHRGIRYTGPQARECGAIMDKICSASGIDRLILLLQLLGHLLRDKNFTILSQRDFLDNDATRSDQRLATVLAYLNHHYLENPSVSEAARLANLNVASFCRYFKRRTGKSFTSYTNTMRVSYARSLLMSSDMDITGICYECGFNNLSYFNRVFREITGLSPRAYRNRYRRDVA
jgi:AraC-like DNA-binding protein/mannose-6-phosphate isomerase-like protein (cupin superfamily)